mgnify:FL=1
MSNFTYAFILSTLAGLSTLFGLIPLLFHLKNEKNIILSSLSFASGVMICVSITDLIPSSFNLLTSIFKTFPSLLFLLIFISLGVIISMLIDKFLPNNNNKNISNKKLYRLGLVSMLAIIIHNIPEGIATFLSSSTNMHLGLSLALAISFHNIPEGISIAIPIYFSTKSKIKAFLYTLISGLSEPLGAILAYLFLSNIINNFIMSIILAMIAGIMIHISIYELLTESLSYKKRKLTITFFSIGFIFMLTSHFLLG